MTRMTVHVGGTGQNLQVLGIGYLGLCIFSRHGLVLMFMLVMAKMRCLRRGLVPAIGRGSRPDGLERHKNQQEGEEQTVHEVRAF